MASGPSPDWRFLATLASITLIGPLAIHAFLPAMPAIKAVFSLSETLAGTAFTVTLLVVAFATLAYGSLSDRHGRRPVLLTGINTLILVSSSFVLWWGEKRLAAGDNKGLIRGLWVTILMGGTFLIVQLNEYAHLGFTPQDRAFSGAFYTLTGFHGAHVLVGLIVLSLCLQVSF